MAPRQELIGDVRQAGLFLGVEIVRDRASRMAGPEITSRIVNELRNNHVLISATGPRANVLKIRPPLIFTRANADFFLERLAKVLSSL